MGLFNYLFGPFPAPVPASPLITISKSQAFADVMQDFIQSWGPVILAIAVIIVLVIYIAAWSDGLAAFTGERSRRQLIKMLKATGVNTAHLENELHGPLSTMNGDSNSQALTTILLLASAPIIISFLFGYTSVGWAILLLSLVIITLPMLLAVIQMSAPTKTVANATGPDPQINSMMNMFSDPKFYVSIILLVTVIIIMLSSGVLGMQLFGSTDGFIVGSALGLFAVISAAGFTVWCSFVFSGLSYTASNLTQQNALSSAPGVL